MLSLVAYKASFFKSIYLLEVFFSLIGKLHRPGRSCHLSSDYYRRKYHLTEFIGIQLMEVKAFNISADSEGGGRGLNYRLTLHGVDNFLLSFFAWLKICKTQGIIWVVQRLETTFHSPEAKSLSNKKLYPKNKRAMLP